MNLGDATLRSVNFSHPRINKVSSRQSITVSDDYYSFSDYASDLSSHEDRATPTRWETPPSHPNSVSPIQENKQSELTLPTKPIKLAKRPRVDSTTPLVVKFNDSDMDRRQRQSDPLRRQNSRRVESATSSPTPGVDDTPYIRFAIEQLTRDEEVRGIGREGGRYSVESDSIYPVERIVPDEGLGYLSQREKNPSERSLERPESFVGEDVFIPVEYPPDPHLNPPLRFRPSILRLPQSIGITLFTALILALLILAVVSTKQKHGIQDYDGFGNSRFFVYSFLPQLIGAIYLLWVLMVETALYRLSPFLAMASPSARLRSNATLLPLFPKSLFLPSFAHFRAGQPVIGICLLVMYVTPITLPLLSALFVAQFEDNRWRWATSQPIAYTLIGIYAILFIIFITLTIYLCIGSRTTGLRQDPRTLADLIVLLHRTNLSPAYSGTSTLPRLRDFRHQVAGPSARLGYWRTTSQPFRTFHAIGEEGAPTRRYSVIRGKTTLTGDKKGPPLDYAGGLKYYSGVSSTRTAPRSYFPFFLRPTFLVLWSVTATILLLAFLVASFLHSPLARGFQPLLPTLPSSAGFSSSTFLYSFLPSLLGTLLFLAATSADTHARALAPWAALANSPGGSLAEHSLLLDYTASLPLLTTFTALFNRDFAIAFLSLLSLLSLALPVLAGGVFWLTFLPPPRDALVVVADLPAFYALVAFVALYALGVPSTLALFSRRCRHLHLPHGIGSLGEQISFLVEGEVRKESLWSDVRGRVDLVTRLVTPPRGEMERARWFVAGLEGGRWGVQRVGPRKGVRGVWREVDEGWEKGGERFQY